MFFLCFLTCEAFFSLSFEHVEWKNWKFFCVMWEKAFKLLSSFSNFFFIFEQIFSSMLPAWQIAGCICVISLESPSLMLNYRLESCVGIFQLSIFVTLSFNIILFYQSSQQPSTFASSSTTTWCFHVCQLIEAFLVSCLSCSCEHLKLETVEGFSKSNFSLLFAYLDSYNWWGKDEAINFGWAENFPFKLWRDWTGVSLLSNTQQVSAINVIFMTQREFISLVDCLVFERLEGEETSSH